jgi:CHAT domain-containing protein
VAVTAPPAPGLPELSGAEHEVENVSKAFPKSVVRAVPHVSETELRKLIADASAVHIAAHTELIPEHPDFARLRLGADARNDGALEASEIAALTLPHLELVVLGACGSASQASPSLGQSAHASSTLASAFMAAGAKSVVATLWPIDDASTAELMLHFYAALAQGKTKPEALDLAREALSKNRTLGPSGAWGSFVLIGDPSPIKIVAATLP